MLTSHPGGRRSMLMKKGLSANLSIILSFGFIAALGAVKRLAQQPAPATATTQVATQGWTAADDHQDMMRQLGVRKLRPGPSGNESAPNHANYDEATANPFPNLPEVLTLKNGTKVTTP